MSARTQKKKVTKIQQASRIVYRIKKKKKHPKGEEKKNNSYIQTIYNLHIKKRKESEQGRAVVLIIEKVRVWYSSQKYSVKELRPLLKVRFNSSSCLHIHRYVLLLKSTNAPSRYSKFYLTGTLLLNIA